MGKREPVPLDLTPKITEVKQPPKKKTLEINEDVRRVTEKTDELYDKAIYGYAVIWRTLAEAVAIAISATIIGLVGGATGMRFFGVIGGILVGIFVGRASKYYYWVLISAPIGALLGLGFSVIFWLVGLEWLPVFVVTAMACVAAGFRSRPPSLRRKNFWESARPLLGAFGGLLFSLIGVGIGWGMIELIQELIGQP
jgi:hypothetical protein